MSENQRVNLENAYIVHRRPYRETSLLLDVFSSEYGKISLIAKGIRKQKSWMVGILQPFKLLRLSWIGRSDLHLLTGAELVLPDINLQGKPLFCGFYVNELVNLFLHRHDPHPELFAFYSATLLTLAESNDVEKALRYFELTLMDQVGYGLQLDYEVRTGAEINAKDQYRYAIGQGPILACSDIDTIHGATLIEMRQRKLQNQTALIESKRLMRKVIDFHLDGKVLKSRSLFSRG